MKMVMRTAIRTIVLMSVLVSGTIGTAAVDVPTFRVDPAWPKIPNNWPPTEIPHQITANQRQARETIRFI